MSENASWEQTWHENIAKLLCTRNWNTGLEVEVGWGAKEITG